MADQTMYRHDLGNGEFFDAYSLTPDFDHDKLEETVSKLHGKANLTMDGMDLRFSKTDRIDSLTDLTLDIQDGAYSVPEPLKPYREAIQRDWESKGKENGPILISKGDIRVPLKVIQGYYCDFLSTKLGNKPAELLPDAYQAGKTVEQILTDAGISIEERGKYFAFAHLMRPSNGEEFLLVQRAKGMGIAADCIATSGSTPDLVLDSFESKKPGELEKWWSQHFADEMQEEFKLQNGDYRVGAIDFFEDRKVIPFGLVQITTTMPAAEIARRAYGDPRVLQEHLVLYNIPPKTLPAFLQKIPVLDNIFYALNKITL